MLSPHFYCIRVCCCPYHLRRVTCFGNIVIYLGYPVWGFPLGHPSCPHQWKGSARCGHLPHRPLPIDPAAASHCPRRTAHSPTIVAVVHHGRQFHTHPVRGVEDKGPYEVSAEEPREAWAAYKVCLSEGPDGLSRQEYCYPPSNSPILHCARVVHVVRTNAPFKPNCLR